MPKKKTIKKETEKKDDRMVADYFRELNKYYEKYGEKTILLWQCGSFYEVYGIKDPDTGEMCVSKFNEFIEITHMNAANKNLSINYNGVEMPVRMAGFTADEYYLNKYTTILVNEGYTVPVWYEYAIEKKKKLRKELHVFSPGTNFSTEKKTDTNMIACYVIKKMGTGLLNKKPSITFGCSSIDIFTGNVKLFQHKISKNNIHNPNIFDELDRFNSIYNPSETIIIHNYEDQTKIDDIIQFAGLQTKSIHIISELDKENCQSTLAMRCEEQVYQREIILNFYNDIKDYDVFLETSQIINYPMAFKSFCFLLDFIYCHNPNLTHKINHPRFDNVSDRLVLANHSLRQLNIVNPHNVKGHYSSVERLINKCVTSMGRRSFKDIILHPTTNIKYLNREYNTIEYIIENYDKFIPLRKKLQTIKDIEFLYRKIIFNKISPIDLYNFRNNLHTILDIDKFLIQDKVFKKYIKDNISTNIINICNVLIEVLERNLNMTVCESLIFNKFEVNFFNKGINKVLDDVSEQYDSILRQKDEIITTLSNFVKQKDKRAGTSLPIKVHFTDKNGMYFYTTPKRAECLKLALHDFEGGEKTYKTIKYSQGGTGGNVKLMGTWLKDFYNKYIQRQDDLKQVLRTIFTDFIISLQKFNKELQDFVKYVAILDIILTKAYISKKYNYCKPKINKKAKKSYIEAKDIRHPLIEQLQINEVYTPNDIEIGKKFNGMLIYGTNGVGKSSINRSVGISVIMAQAGMFVACSKFTYKPYSALYTRILGNDNIFKGLSTFAVEMCEMATIINLCDENSLILGDEVCSGTETASAVSIFGQTLLDLNKIKCSHIFATHFHQINNMDEITKLKKLTIKHMSVRCDTNGVLYYTRKLEDGPGKNMYGLEVCKMFDFPQSFLDGALKLREKYNKATKTTLKKKKTRYNKKKLKGKCEFCNCEGEEVHHLSPQEMADVNKYISTFHKDHPGNLANICKKCHVNFTIKKIIHKKTKTTEGYKLVEQ